MFDPYSGLSFLMHGFITVSDATSDDKLYYLLLFFSDIVLISYRVKHFTSDDITFSYFTSDDMTFAVTSLRQGTRVVRKLLRQSLFCQKD